MSIGDFPENLSQAMLVGCNVSRGIGRAKRRDAKAAAAAGASAPRGTAPGAALSPYAGAHAKS